MALKEKKAYMQNWYGDENEIHIKKLLQESFWLSTV